MKRTIYELVVYPTGPDGEPADPVSTYDVHKGVLEAQARAERVANDNDAAVYECEVVDIPSNASAVYLDGLNGNLVLPKRVALIYGRLPVVTTPPPVRGES